ncbi:GGDEF domain-containing protein, partial [bacterium]|nr:GGDEF domain-containing protein [bacterium]
MRSVGPPPGQSGGLSRTAVTHLYQQPGGPLWIATNGGLARLASGSESWQNKSFAGTGNNSINVIAPGSGGVLWLGTGGGVIRYTPKNGATRFFSHIPGDPHSLGPGANSTLLEDRYGHLWVGGNEAGARGLDILDPASGSCSHYRHDAQDPSSLSSDIVNSIHRDGRGHIWLGTPAGLNRATRAADGTIHFTRTAVTQPVSSINSDFAYNIWARTPGGLLRLDTQSGEISSFATNEGAPDGTQIADQSFRSEDGTLYFGSLHGFSRVDPQKIRQNTTAPQVAITDISVFNRSLLKQPATDEAQLEGSVSDPQRLQLSWKASVFTLELAALHYADPVRNRLAYRLDGFDQNWVEVAAGQRTATYTNLD